MYFWHFRAFFNLRPSDNHSLPLPRQLPSTEQTQPVLFTNSLLPLTRSTSLLAIIARLKSHLARGCCSLALKAHAELQYRGLGYYTLSGYTSLIAPYFPVCQSVDIGETGRYLITAGETASPPLTLFAPELPFSFTQMLFGPGGAFYHYDPLPKRQVCRKFKQIHFCATWPTFCFVAKSECIWYLVSCKLLLWTCKPQLQLLSKRKLAWLSLASRFPSQAWDSCPSEAPLYGEALVTQMLSWTKLRGSASIYYCSEGRTFGGRSGQVKSLSSRLDRPTK